MRRSFLSLVEQAYRIDLPDDQWYQTICEHASGIVPGSSGAMAYSFDAASPDHGVLIRNWGAASVPSEFVDATLELNQNTTRVDAERFYHRGIVCGTVSEMLERDGDSVKTNRTYDRSVAQRGAPDTFGLTASNPGHTGMVINSPLDAATVLNPRVRRAWLRAGVHLHAAYRLREALKAARTKPEAVLDSQHRTVHCEPRAQDEDEQELLRRAARTVDEARAKSGPDAADEALALWQGLVHGRWTLVETFESDGRRLFVAYPNEPEFENPRALTERERLVVSYAVQGDSNKWIAYQLGIHAATVARHLGTAIRKLGLSHRHELIWFYASLRVDERSRKSE